MSSKITISIGNGQGLTDGFKKLLQQKIKDGEIENIDFSKVSLSKWQNVIRKFVDINNDRKSNNRETIFSGGNKVDARPATATDKGDDTWARNMVVQAGDIEFDESEMNMLYKAFGVEFTQQAATGTGTAATTTAATTVTETLVAEGTGSVPVTTTTATATGSTIVSTGTGSAPVTTTTAATVATVSNAPAATSEFEVVKEDVEEIKKGPNSPQPPVVSVKSTSIPSVTFDRAAFDKKVKNAEISAGIVKAQTDAIKIGIKLREDATKVDLQKLNQYGEEGCAECWGNVVNGYFESKGEKVYNKPVGGQEYDSNPQSIKDRVLAGDPENDMTLQQELNETNLQTLISEDANVDLDNITINDQNILKVKDLTLADDNATIDQTGKDLENAAAEINKGITTVNEKLQKAKADVKLENDRIQQQLDIIAVHKDNIKEYLQNPDRTSLAEYKSHEAEIDATASEDYKDYGQYQFAREAEDKRLLLDQAGNMKIVKAADSEEYIWDLSGIENEAVRTNTENALKRLLSRYGDELQSELDAIGAAGAEIETARKGIVEAMQTVVRLEIVKQQLENLRSDLDEKALQLTTISQNLKGIDDFVKVAEEKAEKMYKDEQNDASNAKAAAKKKLGKIQTRANTSRTINKGDANRASYDGLGDEKITKKSGKEIVKGQKLSPKAKKLIDEQNRTATIVQKYDRAVYDLKEAQNRYQVQEVAAAVPADPVVITSVEQVPEALRSKYTTFVNGLSDYSDKIIFQINNNKITILKKDDNKVLLQFDANTPDSSIPKLIQGIKSKLLLS